VERVLELSILSFKAVAAGKTVVAMPPAYTSHACSGCGVLVATGVSVRWHVCPDGGTSLHRDHNAAKNIERLGQRLGGAVAVAAPEHRASATASAPAECQCLEVRIFDYLSSTDAWLQQYLLSCKYAIILAVSSVFYEVDVPRQGKGGTREIAVWA
jgi:hypothetical protein